MTDLCPACQHRTPAQARYCPSCGLKLTEDSLSRKHQPGYGARTETPLQGSMSGRTSRFLGLGGGMGVLLITLAASLGISLLLQLAFGFPIWLLAGFLPILPMLGGGRRSWR